MWLPPTGDSGTCGLNVILGGTLHEVKSTLFRCQGAELTGRGVADELTQAVPAAMPRDGPIY